jgi:hypothetical protein
LTKKLAVGQEILTKKKPVSQETLIKMLLQRKQPRVSQGLPVEKTMLTAAFISVLLLSALAAAQLVNLAEANPFHHVWTCEGDVSPDRSTEPPLIVVLSPENYTVHAVDTVSLSPIVSVGNSSTAFSRVLVPMASVAAIGVSLLVYFRKGKG